MSQQTCIIVGASHAAAQLSTSLRQEGWSGRIILVGEEPWLPYNRPPLSKTFLSGEKSIDDLLIRHQTGYDKVGIECRSGCRVTGISPREHRITLEDGEQLAYDKLALTLGSRVRTLEMPGIDLEGVFYLRDIEDVENIRRFTGTGKRAVIVGGGYIGLETAAMLKQTGMEVTVLEGEERVLGRVTAPEVSAFYTRVHMEEGVDVITSARVQGFAGNGRVSEVDCGDAAIDADLVVIGVGIVPNVELAEAAGMKVDNGIIVDRHCLTSDPDIVAAGDCTRHYNALYDRELRLESVQNAVDQAKVAAATLCGKAIEYNALPWFWSDQYDVKLQIAGLSQGYDQLVIRGDTETGRKFAAFYLKEKKLIAVDAVNMPQAFMFGKRLISMQARPDPVLLADPETVMQEILRQAQQS